MLQVSELLLGVNVRYEHADQIIAQCISQPFMQVSVLASALLKADLALCDPQAFGFINLILWIGNLWFVFKETGWMAAFAGTYMPSQEKQPAPDSFAQGGDYGQQDPYAGSQGGYQPEYGQQGGYNEDGGYSQGYEQQPTSYSNQM